MMSVIPSHTMHVHIHMHCKVYPTTMGEITKEQLFTPGSRSIRRRIGFTLWVAVFLGLTCSVASGFAIPNAMQTSKRISHRPEARARLNDPTQKTRTRINDLAQKQRLYMSSEAKDPNEGPAHDENNILPSENRDWVDELMETSSFFQIFRAKEHKKMPPLLVEDNSVLLYDIFLILNLTASISFWVVHRMSFEYIAPALSEGSLMCILWIISGLFNGAFLYSAVDGHYNPSDERAGPKAAGMLGLHTFINTASLRVMVALISAILEHRKVGVVPGEDLVPMEIAFGLLLLSMWRLLHSSFTPRF